MPTELPKQYEPAAAQEKWSKFWDEKGFFHSEPPKEGTQPEKKPYTIVIPPPNVTGALHMGHALNNTLQDIMIRMKRMQGFEALWVPGVDHAGIATQAVVERRLFEEEKKTRHDIGREALVQRIWAWKDQYQARIIRQLKEMGCSCDWSRTRFTLDDMCAKAVRHFFFKLFSDKLIYRGKRLVNWDTHLQTAVSDDEVFHETVDGNFWYIKYPVIKPEAGEPEFVVVATTRPETMLGDTAVAVHPDPEHALTKAIEAVKQKLADAPEKEKAEIQAELDDLEFRKSSDFLVALKKLAQMAKAGREVMLPLANRKIPLVADEWAKPEKGTGCVKITPAHDPNDYEVALRRELPMINILNKDGTVNENGFSYSGLKMLKAREKIVADLEEFSLLVKVEERVIELAHSDRSKTPIEPFLNDQWFVKMDQLAQSAMDAVETIRHPREGGDLDEKCCDSIASSLNRTVQTDNNAGSLGPRLRGDDGGKHTDTEKIRIHPSRYTKGYLDWLGEKRDWPIGRQLWWGHRIPIWYCKGATEAELKKAFSGRKDVSWNWDAANETWWICSQDEDLAATAVPGYTLTQEEDVLDTWFSSALWPHSTLGWPDDTAELRYYYPTNVLITSRDIITLWVARMVLAGLYNVGEKPFHDVFIHPKILDKYGEGMSKSKGNGVDPLSVMNKFGADALRFALAYLTTESQDIRLALDFECPHCGAAVEQTKKNRVLPKIPCPKCKSYFRTQWAETAVDKALPEGSVIGERFEVARNFCNKLWNAARFVMLNLQEPGAVPPAPEAQPPALEKVDFLEDKWILSRLATVTQTVTECLDSFRFADAARILYDFAWDEFCSFYVEMVKSRLNDETQRPQAQAVLVHVLGSLIRLLHPMVPFVTEEIWQRLREFDLSQSESIAVAAWPTVDAAAIDPTVEEQFAVFQELLRAVREVRASRNVPPKTEISFSVRCDEKVEKLLRPMEQYFLSMAGCRAVAWGNEVKPFSLSTTVPLTGMDVYVDMSGLIDVAAEITKLEKELAKLEGFIKGKETKLGSDFVQKAPAAVVEKERQSLEELKEQFATTQAAIEQLRKS